MATARETRAKQRAVIEFLFAEQETIANFHRHLQHVYGIKQWIGLLSVVGLAECQRQNEGHKRHPSDKWPQIQHRPQNGALESMYEKEKTPIRQKNKSNNPDTINQEIFQETLKKSLQDLLLKPELKVQSFYSQLETSIINAAKSSYKPNNDTNKNSKLKESTRKFIEERERVKLEANTNQQKKIEYEELDKKVKREIRRNLREYNTNMGERGRRLTSREEIVRHATEFYKQVYTSRLEQNDPIQEYKIPESKHEEFSSTISIISAEVEAAIRETKSGKYAGDDGIFNEYLRLGGQDLVPIITNLFNEILKSVEIPNEWKQSTIIQLHKKGGKDDINNYRPISVLPNLYKLFTKIITERMTKILDENQPMEQAGFRLGFSTIDHLQTTNQLFEKVQEFNP
ncbi:hypothetical protein ANN_00960 [Periplaneta americana]|uniref:Reverse transcriptase domain-containing protein n=1 Tax=Periplaneta americana TaxID=6978 RepID=A0ABQ8TTC0_PERAM|nr:hypothetical protein ANN_00960 [Periplaneta americana]